MMAPSSEDSAPFTYKRHEPEKTLLYQIMAANLKTWLSEYSGELPSFIHHELNAFLSCGILDHGFILVDCPECDSKRPVAFSCKCRGFCPSCAAKRMSETAVHLIDNLLPHTPYRQWCITFPYALRFWLATSRKLTSMVHSIVTKMIMLYYTSVAESRGIKDSEAGGITFIQRFGSALNLNVHYHTLTFDGVYALVDHKPKFFHLAGPSNSEVNQVLEAISHAVLDLLRKQGYLPDDAACVERPACIDKVFAESLPLEAAAHASSSMKIAFGPHAGEKVRRIGKGFGYEEEEGLIKGSRTSSVNGFTLHADRYFGAIERKKLEGWISYAARGAFSHKYLSLKDPEDPNGDLIYTLKTPWNDGTEAIVLTPMELIEKLAALIPPPYIHMTRYFGVLSSHSKMRRDIVLKPGVKKGFFVTEKEDGDEKPSGVRRISWSFLLGRIFKIDVTKCEACGAEIPRENCHAYHSPPAIKTMLHLLSLEYRGPPTQPARYVRSTVIVDEIPIYE